MKPVPCIFIISWHGTHDNAIAISKELLKVSEDVRIVYSDPDPEWCLQAPCPLIRRPNELFWEDKFKACLDACADAPMLVVHADCHCEDWSLLAKRFMEVDAKLDNLGVWAPKIKDNFFNVGASRLLKIKNSEFSLCALTDGIVFSLSTGVIERMRKVKYGDNPFGWGIDLLFCTHAHVSSQLVLIDEKVEVEHPPTCGYDKSMAEEGLNRFLKQFSIREYVQAELLRKYVEFNHHKMLIRLNKNADTPG